MFGHCRGWHLLQVRSSQAANQPDRSQDHGAEGPTTRCRGRLNLFGCPFSIQAAMQSKVKMTAIRAAQFFRGRHSHDHKRFMVRPLHAQLVTLLCHSMQAVFCWQLFCHVCTAQGMLALPKQMPYLCKWRGCGATVALWQPPPPAPAGATLFCKIGWHIRCQQRTIHRGTPVATPWVRFKDTQRFSLNMYFCLLHQK